MGIKHIGVGAAILVAYRCGRGFQFQLVLDELQGMVTVEQTCPETHLPAHRPSTGGITTSHERLLHSRGGLGLGIRRDLTSWIGTPEVGDMTMARCLAVPVFQPFLHLAILPHHHRRQLTSHVIQAVGKTGYHGVGGSAEELVVEAYDIDCGAAELVTRGKYSSDS